MYDDRTTTTGSPSDCASVTTVTGKVINTPKIHFSVVENIYNGTVRNRRHLVAYDSRFFDVCSPRIAIPVHSVFIVLYSLGAAEAVYREYSA